MVWIPLLLPPLCSTESRPAPSYNQFLEPRTKSWSRSKATKSIRLGVYCSVSNNFMSILFTFFCSHKVFFLFHFNFRFLSNSTKIHPRTWQSSQKWQEEVAFQSSVPAFKCLQLLYCLETQQIVQMMHLIKLVQRCIINVVGFIYLIKSQI